MRTVYQRCKLKRSLNIKALCRFLFLNTKFDLIHVLLLNFANAGRGDWRAWTIVCSNVPYRQSNRVFNLNIQFCRFQCLEVFAFYLFYNGRSFRIHTRHDFSLSEHHFPVCDIVYRERERAEMSEMTGVVVFFVFFFILFYFIF
jgi:hypothetical protein